MCNRDCSTATCWKWSILAGSVRLKTPPTPACASASVICPSESSVTCCSFSSTFLLLWAAPAEASLRDYAHDTWASFEAMTDARSGLPADVLNADGSTSVQTSTTNIGAYMWSAVVAQRMGLIGRRELVTRLSRTLGTLEGMERYSGQFYNWYDHRTGEKLTVWPPTGEPLTPILSSV